MALTSISLNNGATVIGRVLARNGQVSLINNVLDSYALRHRSTGPHGSTARLAGTGTRRQRRRGAKRAPQQADRRPTGKSHDHPQRHARASSARRTRPAPRASAPTVHGHLIRASSSASTARHLGTAKRPFRIFVRALPGAHAVTARVTFRDATQAKTLTLGYRACADAVLQPTAGPSQFTG